MSFKLFPIGIIPEILGGNPATGYHVWTYQAGTTTPLASYTDSTGGTPNTNPVVFDQYGLKQIWLSTASLYKIIVKDSSDAQTYLTIDNAEGISNGNTSSSLTLSQINTSSGNAILTFTAVPNDVNGFTLIDSATGTSPTLKATGTDPNVGMQFSCQGTGLICSTSTWGLTGILTPPTIGSNQNNYSPANLGSSSIINLNASSPVSITGLATGITGRMVYLYNSGSNIISLTANDTNSSAANRFNMLYALTMLPGQYACLWYNGSNWNVGKITDVFGNLQIVRKTYSTYTNTSSQVTYTNPTSSQGLQLFTQNITTLVDNSTIDLRLNVPNLTTNATNGATVVSIFNNTTLLATQTLNNNASGLFPGGVNLMWTGVLGVKATYTLQVRFGPVGVYTSYINGDTTTQITGSALQLLIEEKLS